MQQQVVIVGGGIIGIFSAIYLKRFYKEVVLIEKENKLGGLLTSYQDNLAVSYDMGTHIPCQTFISEIDDIVFGDLLEDEWEIFEQLKVGNYYNQVYNNKTGFPNLLSLPKSTYSEGMVDFLNGEHANSEYENLSEYLKAVYGATFSKVVYEPILWKLLNKSAADLHKNAFKIFDIKRLVIGDATLTAELKKSAIIDSKCAFPSYTTGVSRNLKYYPKNNVGIKKWIDILEKKAKREGIIIKLDTAVKEIKYDGTKITDLYLDNGEVISPNTIIWTVPNPILLKVTNSLVEGLIEPEFREMRLFNFTFNKKFKVNEHYIYCLDKSMHSYRITLYPNITKSLMESNIFNCTIEVLTQKEEDIQASHIIGELIEMGIIDETFEVLSFKLCSIEKGFPIITPKMVENLKKSYVILTEKIQNVILLGKGKGDTFFMGDSLIEAYEVLAKKHGK